MQSSFQNAISANTKNQFAMQIQSSLILIWKRAFCEYTLIYLNIYIWRAPFQHALSANQKSMLQCQCQVRRSCFGKVFFINVYIYMRIYLCAKLFTRNTIFELGIGIENSFSGMTLNTFRKITLHIYIYINAELFQIYIKSSFPKCALQTFSF